MIRFTGKWVRKSSQEPVAAVRVTFYLTREDLAHQLIAAREPHFRADLEELSKAEIETYIRAQLELNADQANWWGDNYSENYDSEVTLDEALEWGRRQVAKFLVKKLPNSV